MQAGSLLMLSLALLSSSTAGATEHEELPPYDSSHPVEIPPIGPFYGVRLRGLGGAYTAVAEGAEGTLTSLASLANRRPDEAGYFHWDGMFSWLFPAGDLDLTNSGEVTPAGLRLLATGVLVRFGPLGVGLFAESMGMTEPSGRGREVRTNRAVAGAAYALPGDTWIVGAGIHSIGYLIRQTDSEPIETSHPHLGADILFRPTDKNYRFGASLKLRGIADLREAPTSDMPPAVVRPWEASFGTAIWLGDGSINKPLPNTEISLPRKPARTGMLISADLFLIGPPPREGAPAAGLEAYFEDKLQLTRQRMSLGFRVGGETEAIPDKVRIRGGFWLEPSRFNDVRGRLHWTGGLDFLLFTFFDYQWRASMVFDLAAQYRVAGLSLGLW